MADHLRRSRRLTQVIVAGMLVAATLAAPRAQSAAGAITPVSGDSRWQSYSDASRGFDVQFPATWTARAAGDLVEFAPPANEKKLTEVWFGPVQPVRSAWFHDFEQFTRTYEQDARRAGSRILSRTRMVVAGYPAMRLAYEDALPAGRPVVVDFVIGVPVGNQGLAYRLFYATDAGASRRDDAVYRRMLSSLKIRPRPGP